MTAETRVFRSVRFRGFAIALVISLILALAASSSIAVQAHAATNAGLAVGSSQLQAQAAKVKIEPRTLWLQKGSWYSITLSNFPKNGSIVKVTSSNAKAVGAEYWESDYNHIFLTPKKTGKSKVTVTYKVGSSTKKASATYKVKKVPNAFKSITVNGKKINVPTAKNQLKSAELYNFTSSKATVKATPAKGWKIKKINLVRYANGVGSKTTTKSVKNGKTQKLTSGKDYHYDIVLENSSGELFTHSVYLHRQGPLALAASEIYLNNSSSAYFTAPTEDASVTSVSSSDPSVIRAKLTGSKYYDIVLTPLKKGTSTITVKYTHKGKSYTTSAKYTVKDLPKAFASITVNGEAVDVSPKTNPAFYSEIIGFTGTSAIIAATPAKDWTVSYIMAYITDQDSPDAQGVSLRVTNGKAFSLPSGKEAHITIGLTNGVNGFVSYNVSLRRDAGLQLAPATVYLDDSAYLHYRQYTDEARVTSVTSSNPSVIQVTYYNNEQYGGGSDYSLKPLALGTSVLSVVYERNGKSYTTSAVYTVKNYPNPFSSIAVNGKPIDTKEYKYGYYQNHFTDTQATVRIELANGWSFESTSFGTGDGAPDDWSNGSTVTIPSDKNGFFYIELKNSEGEKFSYSISLFR